MRPHEIIEVRPHAFVAHVGTWYRWLKSALFLLQRLQYDDITASEPREGGLSRPACGGRWLHHVKASFRERGCAVDRRKDVWAPVAELPAAI